MSELKWGPIGREVYLRTYSRMKPDGSQESWEDTVKRVVDGNLNLVSSRFREPREEEKLFNLIYPMDMLPAGRHLWMTGVPGREFLNNCHSASFTRKDLPLHFTFTFEELMKGGGVGSNFSNRYIGIYPPVFSKVDLHLVCNPAHPDVARFEEFKKQLSSSYNHFSRDRLVVDDSREGWSNALRELLMSAWDGRDIPLVIDLSMIREYGTPLKSFGGTASGPAPLAHMLTRIANILNSKVGEKLSSLDFMQIDHEISACVISGSKRRSARMSIKHWSDKDIFDFIHCKNDFENHWSTNISIEVDDDFFRALRKKDPFAERVLKESAKNMYKHGEPGFWNSSLSAVGEVEYPFTTNPCGEIAFASWDVCCLGHINLERFSKRDLEAKEAFRIMARFLIRATFGDIVNSYQKEAVERNRRIGVGFFGFHPWLAYQGIRFSESHHNTDIRKKLRSFYDASRNEARKYAFELRIPEPIKVTCVAPTGTISNMPGTTSGCQPIYARYFKRRVRYEANDPNLKELTNRGLPIEDSIREKNAKIVTFYCKDPLVGECENHGVPEDLIEEQSEISLSDHLAVQAMLQDTFADNAISYTINFDPAKMKPDDIVRVLKTYLPHLKGTTMMPEGEVRPQTPLERISREEYENEAKKGLATVSNAEQECATGACPVK